MKSATAADSGVWVIQLPSWWIATSEGVLSWEYIEEQYTHTNMHITLKYPTNKDYLPCLLVSDLMHYKLKMNADEKHLWCLFTLHICLQNTMLRGQNSILGVITSGNYIYIYIYAFSRRFYQKRLTIAFRLYIFISMCSLGIENGIRFNRNFKENNISKHRFSSFYVLTFFHRAARLIEMKSQSWLGKICDCHAHLVSEARFCDQQ